MVTVPEDIEAVVNDAVAACFIEGVVDIVRYSIVKHRIHCKPRQLVFRNAVADCGVTTGYYMENKGDEAVLAVAASILEKTLPFLGEPSSVILHGQVVSASVVINGVFDVVENMQVIVKDAVARRRRMGLKDDGVSFVVKKYVKLAPW